MDKQLKYKPRNTSSINFSDQLIDDPLPKRFIQKTILSKIMNGTIQEPCNKETKLYTNRVTNIEKKFVIPKNEEEAKTISQFRQYFDQNKKFIKPYAQYTRYADNLSQHKNLIRRGLFNAPVQLDLAKLKNQTSENKKQSCQQNRIKSISHSAISSQSSIFKHSSLKRSFKHDFQAQYRKNLPEMKAKYLNNFDKSLKHHASEYKLLMKKQRNIKEDYVVLQNAMNKMLSSQLINFKMQYKNQFNPKDKQKYKKLSAKSKFIQ